MIEYILTRKNVKNINLRIKPDGKVYVSANRFVPKKVIDDFVNSKREFIENAIWGYKKKTEKKSVRIYSEEELKELIIKLCEKAYPYFESVGAVKKFPEIRFKNLKSKWGSCHVSKGVLTFNTNLSFAPFECIVYVVLHEFTHFIHANHSEKFYKELIKVCPDWKNARRMLKEVSI